VAVEIRAGAVVARRCSRVGVLVRIRDNENVNHDSRDDEDRLAGARDRLVRRQRVRAIRLPHSVASWRVTAAGPGFDAVDAAGRRAAGAARSTEAVMELLALLSTPPGAPPVIEWTGTPLDVWTPLVLPREQRGPLTPMRTFLDASTGQRAEISDMLRSVRQLWDVTDLHERIAARADELNRSHPLIPDYELVPREDTSNGENVGYVETTSGSTLRP
jgi:hypothetical protein